MKRSRFTGSAWGILGWSILLFVATLLFIIPVVFVIPKATKWFVENIEIEGRKLEFTTDEPYWGYLKWILFTFITLGIGAFYANKQMYRWAAQHTKFKDSDNTNSDFEGDALMIFAYSVLNSLAGSLYLIPLAWSIPYTADWYISSIKISGSKLLFNHKGAWFGVIGWSLFAGITLGIGAPYAIKQMISWFVEKIKLPTTKEPMLSDRIKAFEQEKNQVTE